ncbi:MAG TPA: Ig-like domain-containing protein, partial [Gemmatimonadales bacterium]
MRLRTTIAGLLAASFALSCGGDGGGVAGVLVVSSVEVTPGITDVILGQTRQFTASPKTSGGIPVPGRSVTWSSSDPLIASVSTGGLVTGVALGGPVRIRASVDGVIGDALVTVRPVPVDRVEVSPSSRGLLVGEAFRLTASAFDAANNPLPGRQFNWQSSAPTIAAVATDGLVFGL